MAQLSERIAALEAKLKTLKSRQLKDSSRKRTLESRRSRKTDTRRKISSARSCWRGSIRDV